MKRFIIIVLMVISSLFVTGTYAVDKRPITPYGDFCPRCSKYGYCRFKLSVKDALNALKDYYRKQGLSVKMDRVMGRFIWATILKGNRVVDRVVLDRKTGRIRSIY